MDETEEARRPLVVFGGRGGGAIVAQLARQLEARGAPIELRGYLNDRLAAGEKILGAPVLGPFDSWRSLPGDCVFSAPLHKVKEMERRAARIAGLGIPEARWATLIDPGASVADDVVLSRGAVVSAHANLQPGVRIGAHVAVRHGASLGHDSRIGDFAFLGINTSVSGYVVVGEAAYVAPGACVREGVEIGRLAIVGLGAVVLDDVPECAVVAGNPARCIGQVEEPGGPVPSG